jgi:predicted ATP-grasp superfamily ATP-dependent carboligase
MGGMDLVRPLGLANVRSVVVSRKGQPQCFSRFTRATIDIADLWERPESLVERLVRFGNAQEERPVLFFDQDPYLLFVSRYREALSQAFRFAIATPALVEDLVDKARFHLLAERLDLPVPATRHIHPSEGQSPTALDLTFPIIVKPTHRDSHGSWMPFVGEAKALRVDTPVALDDLWPGLIDASTGFLAQELIPGPESQIESYHVYVDEAGAVVGDFTGRELRTYPAEFGHSTSVMTTDAADVRALGRLLTERLGLSGVAKLDFKRAPDGRLFLLEVNPRFTFWSHPGAKAGVNLPALVFGDLTGISRPPIRRAHAGVTWCEAMSDAKASRASGMPIASWMVWFLRCQAKAVMAWDDPMPFLRGVLWLHRRRLLSGVSRTVALRLRGVRRVVGARAR